MPPRFRTGSSATAVQFSHPSAIVAVRSNGRSNRARREHKVSRSAHTECEISNDTKPVGAIIAVLDTDTDCRAAIRRQTFIAGEIETRSIGV